MKFNNRQKPTDGDELRTVFPSGNGMIGCEYDQGDTTLMAESKEELESLDEGKRGEGKLWLA